jgi:membrane-bound inhibitor of C-type lysozyme
VRELELEPGWNFVPPTDTDKQVVLAYADASSGGPEFVATCGTGDGIAVTLYRAPDGAAVGSKVDVALGAGGFRGEYPATVSTDGASVVLSTDLDDPLWRALAAYVRLDIDIGSLRPYSLSLRGSGVTVRPFVDACEQAPAAPAGPADAGSPDAGAATPGGSARYTCASGPSLEVFFDNARDRAVVSVEGGEPIALAQARPGSGTLYRAGGYELHSKAGEAVWTEPGNRQYTCRTK